MASKDPSLQASSPLEPLLDRDALRRMAGARSFERGEDYFVNGQVEAIAEHKGRITAKVRGTRPYQVRLWAEKERLEYSCTCPVRADGEFCKHCVAVGLAWREGSTLGLTPKGREVKLLEEGQASPAATMHDVRAYLAGQDKKALVEMLVAQAMTDDRLRGRLFMKAAKKSSKGINLATYRRAIDEAVDWGGFVHYRDAYEYSCGIEEAIDSLQELLKEGHAAEVIELTEHALEAVEEAMGSVDDSDGYMGGILERLQDLHHKASRKAKPDPEALARQTGDVEAVVTVKKRDLSSAYDYLQIAETYKNARKRDLAMEWAERGVKAFPERTDSRLREFLAEEYHRRKHHDQAMALIWAEFTESPGLERYQMLKAHAERAGQWHPWREKALEYLRQHVAEAKNERQKDRWAWYRKADHSELVRIFLWEKDVETAWREAQEGGCSDNLWLELAAKREKKYPEDALPVYQGQIEPTLGGKNKEAYREAVSLLRKVRELMVRLGRKDEFTTYLNEVRAAHKPKRNFMKLLDHARW